MKHALRACLVLLLPILATDVFACSCAFITLKEQLDRAEFVALVRVQSTHLNPDWGATTTQGGFHENPPILADYELLTLYKGEETAVQQLATGIGGGDCGVLLLPGSDVLVVSTPSKDIASISLCSASKALGLRSALQERFPEYQHAKTGKDEALLTAVEAYLLDGEPIHECISDPPRDALPWEQDAVPDPRKALCEKYFETFEDPE